MSPRREPDPPWAHSLNACDEEGCCLTCGLPQWRVDRDGQLLAQDCGCWLFQEEEEPTPNGLGPVDQPPPGE